MEDMRKTGLRDFIEGASSDIDSAVEESLPIKYSANIMRFSSVKAIKKDIGLFFTNEDK